MRPYRQMKREREPRFKMDSFGDLIDLHDKKKGNVKEAEYISSGDESDGKKQDVPEFIMKKDI